MDLEEQENRDLAAFFTKIYGKFHMKIHEYDDAEKELKKSLKIMQKLHGLSEMPTIEITLLLVENLLFKDN